MANRLVSVGDDFNLPGAVNVLDENLPANLQPTALNATILDTGDANYGPPVSAFQDFMGRANTGVSDLNILIVSDSTGAAGGTEPASWARRLPAKIAPLFPAYSVEWVLWDGVGSVYGAPTVVQTGTGTKKIKVWLAAVAGQSWQYHWDTSRREAMLYAPKADLVMFSLGHNDNSTNAQNGSTELIREKPIVHIEQMRTFFPSASVVLLSQNPLLNFNVASENRANVFRRIAAQRGYGFIDVCRAFHDDPRPLTDLILTSDGTHPTEAGYELWANKVLESFRTTPGAQPLTAPPSAFYEPKKNWAPNGDLANVDVNNLPLTWTAQNTTVTKDTVDFETGTYSLVLTKTAGGSTANVEVSLPLGLMRGQTVTVAVRLKVTGDAGLNAAGQIAGRIDVRDSKGIYASDIWNLPDQWVWRMRTHRYDPDVTYTRFRVATDPTTAASAQVKIDRVVAVLGEYPSDLL